MSVSPAKRPSWLTAVIRLRCPLCRQGPIFRKPFEMYERCPHCQIKYEREAGYFLMGIFMGYIIYGLIFVPLTLLFYLYGASWRGYMLLIGLMLLLVPVVFHYARSLRLHIDQILDPRPDELG